MRAAPCPGSAAGRSRSATAAPRPSAAWRSRRCRASTASRPASPSPWRPTIAHGRPGRRAPQQEARPTPGWGSEPPRPLRQTGNRSRRARSSAARQPFIVVNKGIPWVRYTAVKVRLQFPDRRRCGSDSGGQRDRRRAQNDSERPGAASAEPRRPRPSGRPSRKRRQGVARRLAPARLEQDHRRGGAGEAARAPAASRPPRRLRQPRRPERRAYRPRAGGVSVERRGAVSGGVRPDRKEHP